MESMFYNFNMDKEKSIFTTVCETKPTKSDVQVSISRAENVRGTQQDAMTFSPMAPAFQGHSGNDLHTLLSQREPRAGETAPSVADIDEGMMKMRLNGADTLFEGTDPNGNDFFNLGSTRPESISSHSNMWGDGPSVSASRTDDKMDSFDFLIKSLTSANNYVSMLTREQLYVMRCIKPGLLYELLQEVAKVRSDKRMRRALPNECAFCKNNGENEECYSAHALKDWRGRVLCPVLRAFRCPRCGATGDRAHTIKYCPENCDAASERSGGGLAARRRVPPSASLLLGASPSPLQSGPSTPAAPAPSPTNSVPFSHSSLWSSFGMN